MQARGGGHIDDCLRGMSVCWIHPVAGKRSNHTEGDIVMDFHNNIELVLIHLMDCTIVTESLRPVNIHRPPFVWIKTYQRCLLDS